ncbi:hypothetical protein RJ55_06661 [Drechmeria coniospora]|nr:hypothetical protein RJ55_06661 [Drechmeria coniospora]
MYQRAKALYDAGYEKDEITVIQSVFLMSHWFASFKDQYGPWHWNGIAISLSQTLYLDHTDSYHYQTSRHTRPRWRRLWWSIRNREVWLSLGMERPARITSGENGVPMPSLLDADVSINSISERSRMYLPEGLPVLFEAWLCWTKLMAALCKILPSLRTTKSPIPTREQYSLLENEIRACYFLFPEEKPQDKLLATHLYQFKLFFETVIIVLYRPSIQAWNHERRAPTGQEDDDLAPLVCQKMATAASNAAHIVKSLLSDGLIGGCQTMSAIALIPPMHILLLDSCSLRPISRQTGSRNLALFMRALDEMRKSNMTAEVIYRWFKSSMARIDNMPVEETIASLEESMSSSGKDTAADAVGEVQDPMADWSMGLELFTAGDCTFFKNPLTLSQTGIRLEEKY